MKLSINLVLSTLFSAFVLMLIFGVIFAISYINNIDNQSTAVVETEFMKSQVTAAILKDKEIIDIDARDMILNQSPPAKMEIKGKIGKEFEEITNKIISLEQCPDTLGNSTLNQIKLSFDDFSRMLDKDYFQSYKKALNLERNNKLTTIELDEELVNMGSLISSKKLDELLQRYSDQISNQLKNDENTSSSSFSRMNRIIITAAIILFFFGIVVFISVLRFVFSQVGIEPVVLREITKKITEGDLTVGFPQVTHGIYSSVKILNQTLREVAENAESIANGDFTIEIKPRSENDQLGNSLKKMVETLKNLQQVTEEISHGNFTRKLEIKGANDMVSQSINMMSEGLEKNEKINKDQNWLKDGLNRLSFELSGDKDLEQITLKAINFIGHYVTAGRGVIYRFDDEKKILNLISSFAFTERENLSNLYKLGNGVVGQVALEKKPIRLTSLPKDEPQIITGTISSVPYNTYTYPLVYEDELIGVIELASLTPFTNVQMEFLDQSSQVVASGIFTAIQKSKIGELLKKSQIAQREAEEKTMMVQEANARLEEQSQQIQQQTEELQQSNSQLEEQHQQQYIFPDPL